jgi:hypothetical protein
MTLGRFGAAYEASAPVRNSKTMSSVPTRSGVVA